MTDNANAQLPPAPAVWPSVGFVDVDAGIRLLTEGLGFDFGSHQFHLRDADGNRLSIGTYRGA